MRRYNFSIGDILFPVQKVYCQTILGYLFFALLNSFKFFHDWLFLIYFTGASKKKKHSAHFTEGWVEFLSKRVAKEVAANLNNQQISSQKKSRYYDHIWNIKYLPRFKWIHLSERLEYERAVYKQRMRAEIAQVKREASNFAQNVEISEKLAKKKLKNPGNVVLHYKQRKTNDEILKSKSSDSKDEDRTEFLSSLFG
ncbi:activator of basal transcription 1 [Nilaparvata lugens]|uniref:activator of basal transcription 1 n=1 Tax=Nilaparvata lugens TaxID=108931 RepID=UPI00193CED58|nr:activator of basal transcription 1 [Nilaparvata lugens]